MTSHKIQMSFKIPTWVLNLIKIINILKTTSNFENHQPKLFQSQNLDQSRTTPEVHGSSNKSRMGEIFPTQQLKNDKIRNKVTKGKGRGKGNEKEKVNRDRWSCEEDLCVIFVVLNCKCDILVVTDRTKAELWKKIIQIYNDEVRKKTKYNSTRNLKIYRKSMVSYQWRCCKECELVVRMLTWNRSHPPSLNKQLVKHFSTFCA